MSMSMGFLVIATLVILLALGALILVMVFIASRSASRAAGESGAPGAPGAEPVMVTPDEPGERLASLAAGQIEALARARLAAYPDLAGVSLDFGTMPDGTVDVWVDGAQYDDPREIPDARIRQAIAEAVSEFNAGGE